MSPACKSCTGTLVPYIARLLRNDCHGPFSEPLPQGFALPGANSVTPALVPVRPRTCARAVLPRPAGTPATMTGPGVAGPLSLPPSLPAAPPAPNAVDAVR